MSILNVSLREMVEKIEEKNHTIVGSEEWLELRGLLVREGELTPEAVESHLAEVLDSVCTTCLTIDAADLDDDSVIHGHDVRYTVQDAINALHILTHIAGNIRIHRFLESERNEGDRELFQSNTMQLGEIIGEWFGGMVGITPKEFYAQEKAGE